MSDHYIEVRYSNDGANNWSPWRLLDAGQAGDFIKGLTLRRLGFTRHRVWQIRDVSPFPTTILAASIDMEAE